MKALTKVCVATFLMILFGCTPEETFVVVNATALKKAVAGELASAKVEMVFDIQDKDDPDLPNKIRKVALPYLGEGAVINVEKIEKRKVRTGGSIRDEGDEVEVDKSLDGAKLVARFSIPVGTEQALESAPRSIMWLKYTPSDKMFCLVNGNGIRGLNSALSGVKSSIEYEYNGGVGSGFGSDGTTIKIVDDADITIGVVAVKVNGEKTMSGTFNTQDNSLKIQYNNTFYDGLAPCFKYGAFETMRTVRLKAKNSWDE